MSESNDPQKRNVVDWLMKRMPDAISRRVYDRAFAYEADRLLDGPTSPPNNIVTRSEWFKGVTSDVESAWDKHVAASEREPTIWGNMERIGNSEAAARNYDGHGTELNYSLGKSDKGYHYAINEWPTVGPDREGSWSQPFDTLERAEGRAKEEIRDAMWRPSAELDAVMNSRDLRVEPLAAMAVEPPLPDLRVFEDIVMQPSEPEQQAKILVDFSGQHFVQRGAEYFAGPFDTREHAETHQNALAKIVEARDAYRAAEGTRQYGADYGNGPTENTGPWDKAVAKANEVARDPEAMKIMEDVGVRSRDLGEGYYYLTTDQGRVIGSKQYDEALGRRDQEKHTTRETAMPQTEKPPQPTREEKTWVDRMGERLQEVEREKGEQKQERGSEKQGGLER
jgi:hypothetical protein